MPPAPHMPNYVRGVSAAGADTLRAIAAGFAAWQLRAPIDTTLSDPAALAAEYLAKLTHPEHVFSRLPEDAQDRVAVAVGCATQAAWKPSGAVPPGTPSYKAPSWEKDVYAVLFAKEAEPPRAPRVTSEARVSRASAWPELGSLAKWKKTRARTAVTEAIARALGKEWTPCDPAGVHALPRVRSAKLGIALVAVPGGTLEMGLSPEEQRELVKRVKGRGPEAREHVRELAALARPRHAVAIDAFLCAESPLRAKHAKKLRCEGDAANPHEVLRVGAAEAASVTATAKLRLLAEAEWEWVARAAGSCAWLSGDADPEDWARRVLGAAPEDTPNPLGALALGWGEWVDDGWHATYRGAPKGSTAWEPKTRPEVVRGGALEQWPWQVGGELVLLHAAARGRASNGGQHALRLARDLPAR